MKNFKIITITASIVFLLGYLSVSFVTMKPNPFEWDQITRAMYIFLAASGSLLASVPQFVDA